MFKYHKDLQRTSFQPASALLAVDLFSHKLSSPSQEEAMLTIRVRIRLLQNHVQRFSIQKTILDNYFLV